MCKKFRLNRMRVNVRVALVTFVTIAALVLLYTHCWLDGDVASMDGQLTPNNMVPEKEYYMDLLHARELKFNTEMDRLREHINLLENEMQLLKQSTQQGNSSIIMMSDVAANSNKNCEKHRNLAIFYTEYLNAKEEASEIVKGVSLHNEYEIIPFCKFTLKRVFLVDPGMGKRVVEKPIGFKKKDLYEIIAYGIEKLNVGLKTEPHYTPEAFVEGFFRTEPSLGSHYELYYKDLHNKTAGHYKKVVVNRPYGPIKLMKLDSINSKKGIINIILPLAGRLDKFHGFLSRFLRVGIKGDKNVILTVVYFGTEGLQEVKRLMESNAKLYGQKYFNLIMLNENFSRGRGLQVGAQSGPSNEDMLLFLCDVDIVFTVYFLENCRNNAERGNRVYYPIVFSLYNPKVVYALHDLPVPSEEEQLLISKDSGFWRDFGFGMTCQYRSDFIKVKGFDQQIVGWGKEDVRLYQKYVKSELMVMRATDPNIFHLWHEKYCNPKLTGDQYRSCIRSKALNEASHAQLGMLAFKEEVDKHKNLINDKN